MNSSFQQTANCQITICLTEGVRPTAVSIPLSKESKASSLSSTFSAAGHFADNFPHLVHNKNSDFRTPESTWNRKLSPLLCHACRKTSENTGK
jgi:hypothetical protein